MGGKSLFLEIDNRGLKEGKAYIWNVKFRFFYWEGFVWRAFLFFSLI